jgi:hypothetical protein
LDAGNQPRIDVNPLDDRHGFYRFDMQIFSTDGDRIGSFGAYFKVVRPSWRPRLGLSRAVLRPGRQLLIRVENYGSERATYGESFRVQRFENGAWAPADVSIRRFWRLWSGWSSPGDAGRCSSLWLRSNTAPGLYRIVKRVGGRPGGGPTRLSAGFQVIGSDAWIGGSLFSLGAF